jgi:hypothetical protein
MNFQQNKSEFTQPTGLLQPLSIPKKKWERISMEFIMGLPKVQGRDCIYMVVDKLTNFSYFFVIPTKKQCISGGRSILQGGVLTPWPTIID